jgi:hypothetical protein
MNWLSLFSCAVGLLFVVLLLLAFLYIGFVQIDRGS